MDKRTFYGLGIVLGVVTFLLSLFSFLVESIVVGMVSMVLNLRKRKEHRILIGMLFTVLGLIGSIGFLSFMIYMQTKGLGEFDYWLFKLLF